MAIMSTGQITLIDLTDERLSSFYLQANQSKIQVFDTNTKTYSPDYTINPGLIITPHLFFGNDEYTGLNQNNIVYTINGTKVTTSTKELVISQNINGDGAVAPFNQDTLKIIATIPVGEVTDAKTGMTNSAAITAEIEFAKVSTGTNSVGVTDVNQLYKLSDSATSVVAPTENNLNGWSEQNPSWGEGTQYLWICTETIYTDGSKSYSTPYTDNNWKTAVNAVKAMEDSFGTLKNQVDVLQNEVDSVIDTWYLPGEPSMEDLPWGNEDNEFHAGDLYYDTESGKSYRFIKKVEGENISYEWQLLSDNEISAALQQVANLQTVIDSKVTIYYDEEAPADKTKLKVDDLWMPANGNFYKWNGEKWDLANEVIDRIEVQYNKNQSNTEAPAEDDSEWSTATPVWEEGFYIWQRTVTYYREDKKVTKSTPTCISVAGAAGADGANAIFAVVESGSKILFTDKDEADIVLTASLYIGGEVYDGKDVNYQWSAIPADAPAALVSPTKLNELVVQRKDVLNLRTFICEITYNGEPYTDRITITDRTDPVYCVIESTNGDKFTNGNVETNLICKVFDGTGEIDVDGTKYNYKWFKTEAKKEEIEFGTGKTITIGRDDVTAKAVFSCIVEKPEKV